MEHPTPNPPEAVSAGHEIRDAAPRPILIFAAALVVTLVVVHLIGWGAYDSLRRDQEKMNRSDYAPSPLRDVVSGAPPDPRLEPEPSRDVLPHVDLADVQSRERALIGGHAWNWADASHQFARIPLEQAMNLVVQGGLPETLPATQPSTLPVMPAASALHGPGGVP